MSAKQPPQSSWPEDEWPPGATPIRPKAKPEENVRKAVPLNWPELAAREPPERRWAIKGWLGFGHVTLLVGSGGIGKTLIAQQMASCLALGKPFIGDIPNPLKCLMWACEDDHDELWRRQVAIAKWCDTPLDEFHDVLTIIPRHGLENSLVSSEFGKLLYSPLIGELSEQAQDLKSDVVILDNVGQLYGAGENDRHAVTAFLNALSGALPGKALLLLAHPSRSMGSEFSGSSAWENVARTRLYLGATLPGEKSSQDAEPEDNVRYLARRKANYSPRDWRKLNYKDGALTPEVMPETGGLITSIRAGTAEKCVLAGIQALAQRSMAGTDGASSPRFLPRMLLEFKLSDGHTKHELSDAMRRLIMDGRIARVEVGKTDKRNPIFGLRAI